MSGVTGDYGALYANITVPLWAITMCLLKTKIFSKSYLESLKDIKSSIVIMKVTKCLNIKCTSNELISRSDYSLTIGSFYFFFRGLSIMLVKEV